MHTKRGGNKKGGRGGREKGEVAQENALWQRLSHSRRDLKGLPVRRGKGWRKGLVKKTRKEIGFSSFFSSYRTGVSEVHDLRDVPQQ